MIFTNGPRDTLLAAFDQYTQRPTGLLLACPFFTSGTLVLDMLKRGCSVKLVVRLTAATNPNELRNLLNQNVAVRFFTSPRFHSKLYIFLNEVALVGSANLTDAGIQSNREVCIGINREDARFDQLVQLFQGYWNDSKVLDIETLQQFQAIWNANKASSEETLEKEIKARFGDISPSGGVLIKTAPKSNEQVYLDTYGKVYQEFLSAFRKVEKIYKKFDRRHHSEKIIPLRIEIDQFFSFIREDHAHGDAYLTAPLLYGADLENNIRNYTEMWFGQRWQYLDNDILYNYPKIKKFFGTQENVAKIDYDTVVDGLMVCHAFRETYRFHKGGESALRSDFKRDNPEGRVKKSITYLLFGDGDFIKRMGNCIFNPEYALTWFGRSCVQELFGWVNTEGVPICNGRTVKALRFLGLDVETFGG